MDEEDLRKCAVHDVQVSDLKLPKAGCQNHNVTVTNVKNKSQVHYKMNGNARMRQLEFRVWVQGLK